MLAARDALGTAVREAVAPQAEEIGRACSRSTSAT
jgi:hypothetical protein